MNGRIYDALLGRFLSADLVVQAPANLQSYNRYSYVMNNPLTLTDPSGFSWLGDAWSTVQQFTAGAVVGYAQGVDPTMGAISRSVEQHVQNSGVPGVPASLSTAEAAGRVVGNVAAMVQGLAEINVGLGLMAGGGTAAGVGAVGGVATSPTGAGAVVGGGVTAVGGAVAAGGAVVTAHGVLSTAQGAVKAVGNLQNLAKVAVKSGSDGGKVDPAKAPVKEGEITTLQDANKRGVKGDKLEAHEPWQHANQKAQGLTEKRLDTAASKDNPVVMLDQTTHKEVTAAQKSFDPKAQTPGENINANINILRDKTGLTQQQIEELERLAKEHANTTSK